MEKINLNDVSEYIEKNIGYFHQQRIDSLDKLKLSAVLKRKNPYLFKAKFIITAHELVKYIIDAHISSHEETIFGEWLEKLAIFINSKVYEGRKSGIPGIDLEFDKDDRRYIISIKSGPNWGNSKQIEKMKSDFDSAIRTLRTSDSRLNVIAVNGCCYGKDNKPLKKGNYYKYCGQAFWEFISGDRNLYTEIIEPLGKNAEEKNNEYMKLYSGKHNLFTLEFINEFCDSNGIILWKKLVEFNSGNHSADFHLP